MNVWGTLKYTLIVVVSISKSVAFILVAHISYKTISLGPYKITFTMYMQK